MYLINITYEYYNKINENYKNLQNYLKESIKMIGDLLKECANKTIDTFEIKYDEISKMIDFFNVNHFDNEEKNVRKEYDYSYQNEGSIKYVASITKPKKHAEFYYNLKFEGTDFKNPVLEGRITNISGPKKMNLDILSGTSICGDIKQTIDIEFGNSNYTLLFNYNPKENENNKINITEIILFDKYKYTKKLYEFKSVKNNPETLALAGLGVYNFDPLSNFDNCKENEVLLQDYTINVSMKNETIQTFI